MDILRSNNLTSSFKSLASSCSYMSLEGLFEENERIRLNILNLKRDISPSYSSENCSPLNSIIEDNIKPKKNRNNRRNSFTLYPTASLFLPDIDYDTYNKDINSETNSEVNIDIKNKCKICNKIIKSNDTSNQYCSYWCSKKSHIIDINLYEFKCKKCNKLFETHNIFNDYCSDECFSKL